LALKANVVDLTTANVFESASNLYYTNTRVASYLASANIDTSFGNVTVLGNLYIKGDINEINSNVLYVDDKTITVAKGTPTALLADGSGLLIDGAGANITYSYSGDKFVLTKGLDVLNGTLNVANISVVNWSGIYTANVAESNSNLYYTNARVYSNIVTALTSFTTSNINEGSNLYYTNARVYSNIVSALYSFTTSNINEGSNLYYTNARVISAVTGTQLSNLSVTGNVYAGNLIAANSIILQNINVTSNILSGSINTSYLNSSNIVSGNLIANIITTTGNVYAGNLIIANTITLQNINVTSNILNGGGSINTSYLNSSNIISGNVSANIITASGNVYVGNLIVANTITLQSINVTSNIINGGGSFNTSYINSSNVVTGNIQASAWYGLANLAGTGLIVSTNATTGIQTINVDTANVGINAGVGISGYDVFGGGNKNYTLSRIITNNNANIILVSINGLEQIPTIDYTLTTPQTLSFTANTAVNSTISVKYLGYSTYVTPNAMVLVTSTVIPTIQGQSSYMMGANVNAPEKILVHLDGLTQRPTTDYTVNNTTLTFTSAPPEGSNIEIRFLGQEALALNGAANTTSYISNSITLNGGGNTFNLGSNVAFARNIIVNVDGLAQIPVTDYNISGGNTLIFTSNVSANSVVEVKFFGAEALGTINFNNTIVAASLTGGNGVKISSNGIITLDVLSPFLLMGA
jgi:hypothetical protein